MNEIIKISVVSTKENVRVKKKTYYTDDTKESVKNITKIPIWLNLENKYISFLEVDKMDKNIFPPLFYNSNCIVVECYVWSEDVNQEKIISLIDVVENEFKLQKKQIEINLENIVMFKKNYVV